MALDIPSATRIYRNLMQRLRSGSASQELLVSSEAVGPFTESFRLIALTVNSMLSSHADQRRGLAVISAYPGDGRTLIAANLAWALSAYGRVIVFDGDRLGENPIGEFMGAPANPSPKLPRGVRAAYTSNGQKDAWLDAGEDTIIRSSADLADVVAMASAGGITCIVDTPPAIASSDAFEVAQKAGNAIYVMRDKVQDMEVHREIRKTLERLNVNLLGVVQNGY